MTEISHCLVPPKLDQVLSGDPKFGRSRRKARSGAEVLLTRAADLMAERGKEYDKSGGERSVPAIIAAFNAITGRDLTESEGWLFLQLLKQVRLFNKPGYHADSAEDNVAYAALLGEAKAKEGIKEPDTP